MPMPQASQIQENQKIMIFPAVTLNPSININQNTLDPIAFFYSHCENEVYESKMSEKNTLQKQ